MVTSLYYVIVSSSASRNDVGYNHSMENLAREALSLFNIHLTGRHILALTTFERELLDWNQKFNLTAIRDVESIRTKHFLDSFSCVQAGKPIPRFASWTWVLVQGSRAFL